MNNKKGGFGAKFLLVLILMIASAAGGAYGYSILDGKMAARDALKAVENVDVSDYDTAEQGIIQGYIDDAKKDLETAKTRKDVYEIISDFVKNVDKVQTKAEKELEAALKEAEEAFSAEAEKVLAPLQNLPAEIERSDKPEAYASRKIGRASCRERVCQYV